MSGRVWLVTKGELEDLEIVAAAPTKPLAEEMARLANGDRYGDPDDDWWEGYDVREVPLIVSVDDGVRWYSRGCRVVGDGRVVDERPRWWTEFPRWGEHEDADGRCELFELRDGPSSRVSVTGPDLPAVERRYRELIEEARDKQREYYRAWLDAQK